MVVSESKGTATRFPRTRGDEPGRRKGVYIKACVFPAHAGMSLVGTAVPSPLVSFPRTRGDEPDSVILSKVHVVFSPHTRG